MRRSIALLLFLLVVFGVQSQQVVTSLKQVGDPLKVTHLKLTHKQLRHVPEEIRAMKNLEVLDLSKNHIDTLPSWIGELVALRQLDVSRNNLWKLPDALAQLDSLRVLDANRNPLIELPDAMGFMTHLQQLILWSTGISFLPPTFVMLDGVLQLLDLRACMMNKTDQDEIDNLLPNTRKLWNQACNCK